jgi:hypothetical protein
MNYRSHRYDRSCGRPRWDCDSYGPIERCDPPISWPQRPSNFPSISISWPMPMIAPIMPWLGGWGTVRWSAEGPPDADRRRVMYRDRCCEPSYRRHERCCERCGCYPCRCERCDRCGCYECRCEQCERCGYYGCRCERCERCGYYDCRCGRCDKCGYYDCRCERCAKCGQRECRCEGYFRSPRVEVRVEAPAEVNCKADIDKERFDPDALPAVEDFADKPASFDLKAHVQISTDVVRITVRVTHRGDGPVTRPYPPARSKAAVRDLHRDKKFLADLTVTVY